MREDAATEADLIRGGYRDRAFTELAQNAADAADRVGVPGRLAVWVSGRELHVANTGAPVDRAGVAALTALRASGKDPAAGTVGRFGVGFTAVRTWSDEIEIRSRSGSVRFSAERTRAVLAERGIVAAVDPAVLRLVWPSDVEPTRGDTEVVLQLRPDLDSGVVLDRIRAEAVDLLLELPALDRIEVAGIELRRTLTELGDGRELIAIGDRSWWQYRAGPARWLLPLDRGRPVRAARSVLRAPTRSDEELSLPALLIAPVALQPDRRRLLPGARIDDAVIRAYSDFAGTLPIADRLVLVPPAGFPRSELDGSLHERVLAELRTRPWLPVLAESGAERPTIDLAPTRAMVFPGLTPDLAAILAEVSADLVIPDLSGPTEVAELMRLGVRRLGLADLTELLVGVHRPPDWWARLYPALTPFAVDWAAAAELGGLPVPLADGRLVTGPRTTLLAEFGDAVDLTGVSWARLVHPAAADPLLARLGARPATAAELLAAPDLLAMLDDGFDDSLPEPGDRSDVGGLAPEVVAAVLHLAGSVVDPTELPAELGLLPLPDETGAPRPADELLLPGAPLAPLLVPDSPFGTVAAEMIEQVGARALRAVGVGWGFTTLRVSDPTGPDPRLADAERWWDDLLDDPAELVAVRDLDLVADDAWAGALGLLAADPATRELLADPSGYTGWWLRRHARLGGIPLGRLRRPGDRVFAGLLDECVHPDAAAFVGLTADPERIDVDLAQALVDALGDPARRPTPAVVVDVHRRLAAAVTVGRLDPAAVRLPDAVRAVTGAVVDPEAALVLDRPWLTAVIPGDRLIVGDPATAASLAALLDLPLASTRVAGRVGPGGRRTTWAEAPAAVLASTLFGIGGEATTVTLHDDLTVRLTGELSGSVAVPWWVDDDGETHLRDWLVPQPDRRRSDRSRID